MTIHVGDCLEVMRVLDASSFDSIVTDPPYGLGFMGKAWDHAVPGVPFWLEMLRVAKPGAYLAAFGGTRTFHRMACAIEDAGWELRDTLMWVYGSGFPKSHNGEWGGTALKPAWEPIVLARKPLSGTVEANWKEHGTGALNIDGCRIGYENDAPNPATNPLHRAQGGYKHAGNDDSGSTSFTVKGQGEPSIASPLGRWPANLLHDGSDEVLACFPNAPGQQGDLTGNEPSRPAKNTYGEYNGRREFKARRDGEASADRRYTEAGATNFAPLPGVRREATNAARFFYCAKADRADRNAGCDGMAEKPLLWSSGAQNPGSFQAAGTKRASENNHPTVKPTDLMRWLCRLLTPAGGLILDPFCGSGSTGRGALADGFRFVGIELSPEYAAIAEARIRAQQPGFAFGSVAA